MVVPSTVVKPWGWEYIWALATGKYAGKILHVNPQSALSWQYHIQKTETLMLLFGKAFLRLDDSDEVEMLPNCPFHIEPGQRHQITTRNESADIVEVSTTELDDVVRLADQYGRV